MPSLNPFQYVKTPTLDTSGQMDQASLMQKQKLIDALRTLSITPQAQTQGGVVARQSLLGPIAQVLGGVLAKRQQGQLDKQYKAFGDAQKQKQAHALAGLLGGQQQPDPTQSVMAQPQPTPPPQQSVGTAGMTMQSPSMTLDAPALQPQPAQQDVPPPEDMKTALAKANNALANGVPKEVVDAYLEQAKQQNKPVNFEFGVDGTIRDPRKGVIMNADKQPLTDAQFLQRRDDAKAKEPQPLTELAKLKADLDAGRINKAQYDAKVNLETTRAPNMYSTPGDPNDLDSVAQMVANYEVAPPSSMRMQTPQGLALMARVKALNPTYQAQEFASRNSAYRAFGSGKQGDQVRSFNVGISHLNTAGDLADALNNGDVRLINKISNQWAEQTGSAAPTNLETAKEVIKAEIVKAVSGAGGGVADRERALSGIDKASSPAQLKGAIEVAKKLMGGQLGGLKRQFEQSTGRKDFENLLSPDALPYLQTKEAQGNENVGSGPKKISSDAEYNSLPSGAEFIGPDGKHRRKP